MKKVEGQIIDGVNNNLLFVHITYIIALVFFVFRNGEKAGVRQLCELLIEDKVVSRSQLNKLVDEKGKKKK